LKTTHRQYTEDREGTISDPSVERKKMGRRALMAGGGLAALGVIVAEAPLAVGLGRHLLAEELANLEGIGLDAAEAAADATFQAVEILVMPFAQAFSEISLDTLKDLVFAVGKMDDLAGSLGLNRNALQALRTILTGWEASANAIPATIHQLDSVQRDAAKRYIGALKKKQKEEADKVW
jgi:hypothetical protein